MGSVIDSIDCPNCSSPDCFVDFYYKTGEEYNFCSDCGYSKQITIINRDKKLNELTDDDWRIEEAKNPWGSFRIQEIGMVGWTTGTIQDESQYNEIYNKVIENLDSIGEFSISRLIDGKIEKNTIVLSGRILNEMI